MSTLHSLASVVLRAGWLVAIPCLFGFALADAQEDAATKHALGLEIFDRSCDDCHTIGLGDSVGPDLQDVHQRRERLWLVRWIRDPLTMAQKDSIGRELFAKWNEAMRPASLSNREANAVIDYIIAVSEGTVSRPKEHGGT